ncbi:LCP family protein [Paraclostridium bifermentans]|uniref:LCP family protein n=1 Tax=Paraclostridium bifermentans TaxID=1490 RepID=UPI002FCCDC4C
MMRDSYVAIDGHGNDKLNHAYAFGGPQLAIKTLNENFDLNIENFASVNFETLPKIIDELGGIELNIDARRE